jgi:hypothetical protein
VPDAAAHLFRRIDEHAVHDRCAAEMRHLMFLDRIENQLGSTAHRG